jgi:DNA-binding MarR family transcriptional regulator
MIVSELNNNFHPSATVPENGWVGYLLNQAALHIRTMSVLALGPLQVTPPQLRALETIAAEQPLSQTRLGERVNMDRSTIVHVVDHFEALDLAARTPDPTDRRSHAVVLTKKGERVLAEARDRARAAEDEFLSPLSRGEREALRTILHKLFDPSPCPEEKKNEPRTPPSKPG